MKMRYEKEDDILMIWFSNKPVDYAEQTGSVIMHFTKDNRPVLMEVLDASAFLRNASQILPASVKQRLFA